MPGGRTSHSVLPPAEIGTAQQENPVNYINLPRAQREIVLRTWRTTLLYPLPKEVVTELIQLALSKHNAEYQA